jgi:hypothetical protein
MTADPANGFDIPQGGTRIRACRRTPGR